MKVEYGKIFITFGSVAIIVLFFWLMLTGADKKKTSKHSEPQAEVNIIVQECPRDTISLVRASYYNAKKEQTDASPFNTADGSKIDNAKVKSGEQRWVALSRDLINDQFRNKSFGNGIHWNGLFKFGDTVELRSNSFPNINGKWVVHDCMNSRYFKSIDLLTYPGVRLFGGKGKIEDVKIVY